MADETVYKAQLKGEKRGPSRMAWVLIGLGAVLLAFNLAPYHFMNLLWPGLIIGPGLLLLWPAYNSDPERQSSLSFLAVPGAALVAIGLLSFVMNLSDHWESWAYAWTLLPAALVAGAMYMKRFEPGSRVHTRGHKIVRGLILAFMGLAVFFEVFIFTGMAAWWPLLLIGGGLYLLITRRQS